MQMGSILEATSAYGCSLWRGRTRGDYGQGLRG